MASMLANYCFFTVPRHVAIHLMNVQVQYSVLFFFSFGLHQLVKKIWPFKLLNYPLSSPAGYCVCCLVL